MDIAFGLVSSATARWAPASSTGVPREALEESKLYYHSGGITVESSARLGARTFERVTDAVHGRQPEHGLNPEGLDHPRVRAWLREAD